MIRRIRKAHTPRKPRELTDTQATVHALRSIHFRILRADRKAGAK